MSQAGSERGEGDIASVEELTDLVGVLRAELQSIRERELRREGRLVTFDQQVAQMEASLGAEVERLRSTGSAVDLITEHLRIAVREMLAEREELSHALAELGTRLDTVGPPDLQPISDHLDQLRDELRAIPTLDLQSLHDRLDRVTQQLAAAQTADLQPLEAQVERLQTAVAEGLRTIPGPDDTAVRADLAHINQQVDSLRTSLTDRFDAIPAPDLTSIHEVLSRLDQQVAAIPAADLASVEEHLAQLDERVAGLPRAEQVAGAMAPQLETLQQAANPAAVIEAVEAAATRLAGQIGGLPDQVSVVSEVLSPLSGGVERLLESDAAVRGDLALVTEVLAGLTQLAESGDQQLGSVLGAQRAVLSEQRTLVAEAGRELSRSVTAEVHQLESQLADLISRTGAIADVDRGLTETRDALAALTARADRAEESGRETADTQALSLARVTAAADGLSTSLGSLRSSITSAIDSARDTTVTSVGESLTSQLADATARLEDGMTAQLREHLGDLGISQLRVSVAELTQQVVEARSDDRGLLDVAHRLAKQMSEGRADDRRFRDAVAGLKGEVTQLGAEGIAPLRGAVDELRARVDSLPVPDLGAVASQLARLSATIVSQARHEVATPGHVEAVGQSLEATMRLVAELLGAQTEATARVFAQLEVQAQATDDIQLQLAMQRSALERADDLREDLARVSTGLHGALGRIAAEVAATREAAEKRPVGPRWRRGSDDDAPRGAPPAGPSEFEQRVEHALSALDRRMGSLAELAERAAAFADDAAKAAATTLRLTPNPTPPSGSSAAEPAPKPAAQKPTAKKAPAKKAPAKKVTPAKKATARKATSTARAGAAKKAPAKKAPGSSGA